MPEITSSQLTSPSWGIGPRRILPRQTPVISYATYRAIRKNPTISLVRILIAAGIVSGGWSIEADDDANPNAKQLVMDELFPIRDEFVERVVLGTTDFGWQPFELVLVRRTSGRIGILKMKPLLQDITDIMVDDGGNFAGFVQSPMGTTVDVPLEFSMLFTFRGEGGNLYGESLLEPARLTYDQWLALGQSAAKYDLKIVGTRLVVYYPPGTTTVAGVVTENSSIAQDIIDELELNGSVAVPTTVAKMIDELNAISMGWKIEVLQDKGGAASAYGVERLRYLDAQLVRALGFPERAVLEAVTAGSRADADSAVEFALKNLELISKGIAKGTNVQGTDRLLLYNYGPEQVGKVYVVPGPITSRTKDLLTDIAKSLIAKDSLLVDVNSILDEVEIPKAKENVKMAAARETTNV